jgi:hypothetical protein
MSVTILLSCYNHGNERLSLVVFLTNLAGAFTGVSITFWELFLNAWSVMVLAHPTDGQPRAGP